MTTAAQQARGVLAAPSSGSRRGKPRAAAAMHGTANVRSASGGRARRGPDECHGPRGHFGGFAESDTPFAPDSAGAATWRGAPAGALPADGSHDPRPRQHPLACRRDAHMGPGRCADPCEIQKRVRSPLLGSQHCL